MRGFVTEISAWLDNIFLLILSLKYGFIWHIILGSWLFSISTLKIFHCLLASLLVLRNQQSCNFHFFLLIGYLSIWNVSFFVMFLFHYLIFKNIKHTYLIFYAQSSRIASLYRFDTAVYYLLWLLFPYLWFLFIVNSYTLELYQWGPFEFCVRWAEWVGGRWAGEVRSTFNLGQLQNKFYV